MLCRLRRGVSRSLGVNAPLTQLDPKAGLFRPTVDASNDDGKPARGEKGRTRQLAGRGPCDPISGAGLAIVWIGRPALWNDRRRDTCILEAYRFPRKLHTVGTPAEGRINRCEYSA